MTILSRDHRPGERAVLPAAEKGELVLTSLLQGSAAGDPLRTRDLTRLLPGTARTMRRMEKITGRSDDMLIIRALTFFPRRSRS